MPFGVYDSEPLVQMKTLSGTALSRSESWRSCYSMVFIYKKSSALDFMLMYWWLSKAKLKKSVIIKTDAIGLSSPI